MCANKPWSISNACKNLREQQPLGRKCSLLQNVHLGGSLCTPRTFLFVDQSSPNFFRPTWKRLRLIKFFFRCSICRSVPEIFAMKVESCQKWRIILDDFFALIFLGAGTAKIVPALSPLPRGTSTGKSPVRILPLTRKLLKRIR